MNLQALKNIADCLGFTITDRGHSINASNGSDFICTSVEATRENQITQVEEFMYSCNVEAEREAHAAFIGATL